MKWLALSLLLGSVVSIPLRAEELPDSRALTKRMVLIIDDLGNNKGAADRVLEIPGLTLAILPNQPYTRYLAERAGEQGREVMLHMPMTPNQPGRNSAQMLTAELDEQSFKQRLSAALDQLPEATGLNNHMGSALTQLEAPMRWVMEVAREKQLFFVDSRTSAQTRAEQVAIEEQVPNLARQVFLDHDPSLAAIQLQFDRAIALADKGGEVVVIGHPYKTTLAVLAQRLPGLADLGVQLVGVNQLLALRAAEAAAVASARQSSEVRR